MSSYQPTRKQWGVSPSISWNPLTKYDEENDAALIAEMRSMKAYEGPEMSDHRKKIMLKLGAVVVDFIKVAGRKKGYSQAAVNKFGGQVVSYGSYRLGVVGPGSDIDALIIAPKQITRVDFFDCFESVLRRHVPASDIGKFNAVPDSFVPIIKMVVWGVDVDLIFARIPLLDHIPPNFSLKDRRWLEGMEDIEIKSVNGPRVTDEMLALIPEPRSFRVALRAIKLWAKRRGIYANIMGYPGGVAWAIMVARVCQLYPLANGAILVEKFFLVMLRWDWPQPVLLKDLEKGKARVWNPKIYWGDEKNIMPVITPAYPSMCSTYNITQSTMMLIEKELQRALDIMLKVNMRKLPWTAFFERHSFFTEDYKFYVAIQAHSTDEDAARAWSGLVESKVRIICGKLDENPKKIALACPFMKGFERVHHVKNNTEAEEVAEGSMKYKIEKTTTTDETNDPIRAIAAETGSVVGDAAKAGDKPKPKGEREIYSTTFYVGLEMGPESSQEMNFTSHIKVMEDTCQKWDKYTPGLHKLDVFVMSRFTLPDDVFDKEKGDVKPVRPPKAKVMKKRAIRKVDTPAAAPPAKRVTATNGAKANGVTPPETKPANAVAPPKTKPANGVTTPKPKTAIVVAPAPASAPAPAPTAAPKPVVLPQTPVKVAVEECVPVAIPGLGGDDLPSKTQVSLSRVCRHDGPNSSPGSKPNSSPQSSGSGSKFSVSIPRDQTPKFNCQACGANMIVDRVNFDFILEQTLDDVLPSIEAPSPNNSDKSRTENEQAAVVKHECASQQATTSPKSTEKSRTDASVQTTPSKKRSADELDPPPSPQKKRRIDHHDPEFWKKTQDEEACGCNRKRKADWDSDDTPVKKRCLSV